MIKSAIFLKQQLKYEEARSRHPGKGSSTGGRLLFGKLESNIDYGVAMKETLSSSSGNARSKTQPSSELQNSINK